MPNHQTEMQVMEAARSSRSSSSERDDLIECESPKMRDVELVDSTTASDQNTSAGGESSAHQTVPCSQENSGSKSEVASHGDDDVAMVLRRRINECGLGGMRVPELHVSGCSDGEETESDEDDDLCSSSDDEESYNPLASGVMPPVLPDIKLRVPMEDANDVQRVKDALLIKGVLDVVCDEERQIVTVTGIVPPVRLLKKVRKVKQQARIISTVSPFAVFVNPNFRTTNFVDVDEEDSTAHSNAIDIPLPHPIPNFVVHQQRPRPTFQGYNFHNDPHSPNLRTFSPTDLSPANSPSPATTGDAFPDRFDSPFFDDDLYQGNVLILT